MNRLFDIVFCLVTAPVWVVAGMVVLVAALISDGRPVFYFPQRSGKNGVPFTQYKFRTMIVGADKCGPDTTAEGDSRITRLGHVLRKYKLDEVPQFINVLKGDMSVVGPRPEIPKYTTRYSEAERCILKVRPGITDDSSLKYFQLGLTVGRDNVDEVYETMVFHKKNQLRLDYVNGKNVAGDLRIILKTLRAVLVGHN